MRKRVCALLFLPIFLAAVCCGCTGEQTSSHTNAPTWDETPDFSYPSTALLPDLPESSSPPEQQEKAEFLNGVWISYLELNTLGSDPALAQQKIDEIMDNIVEMGLNAVFFHVRPFADALYASRIYPSSYIFTGAHGRQPDYDLLSMATAAAHARKLSFHAWINPYRVQSSSRMPSGAQSTSQYAQWEQEGMLLTLPSGVYFDPASEQARSLIAAGAAEIAANYSVDSIIIDDYFYPADYGASDEALYGEYLEQGGELTLEDWRREQVNLLIRSLYDSIHAANADCRFGVSPAADIDKNYAVRYADVAAWAREPGWVDYLVPQIYFGFDNAVRPFTATAQQWAALCVCDEVELYAGLAAYKTGEEDRYAGAAGGGEWQQNDSILARQVQTLSGMTRYHGAVFYSYGALFGANPDPIRERERTHLREQMMQMKL